LARHGAANAGHVYSGVMMSIIGLNKTKGKHCYRANY
jgi:hypothetical protein